MHANQSWGDPNTKRSNRVRDHENHYENIAPIVDKLKINGGNKVESASNAITATISPPRGMLPSPQMEGSLIGSN